MVKISRALLKNAEGGISMMLTEILVCPISKQPLRHCEETGTLISDTIGVSFPIVDGIPCLVPHDGKIHDHEDGQVTTEGRKTELMQLLLGRKEHRTSVNWLSRTHSSAGVIEGQERRILPCVHEFHECVDRWFDKGTKTRPVCRFPVGSKEDGEELNEEMVIWFSPFHIAGFLFTA